ncbi:FRG domain-containing protein [Heliorestis acidaminivorans]|uniref:FRG domain-containing protein n=1 Tax=Heliorestis acidaminivorans TaxID=553427 RepID=A0A6I0F4Y8_9FIRM|nr:FRG domain-containing protein [Heliorestis acidaminivorans]KAB2953747.1 FRG domain-containing protein [Heliorestis acidaminivorans]
MAAQSDTWSEYMSEYISRRYTDKLDNRIIDITYEDIKALLHENEKDAKECEAVTRDSYAGKNFYSDNPSNLRFEFYKEVLYRDPKTSGFIMQYPHGVVIRQAERNNYYRGENQIFSKSVPSLIRTLNQYNREIDKELYKLVADMRIAEFGMFLFEFDFVKNWATRYSDVLFEALAQHYGLETNWLDITNDFNVALFFATCYYDGEEKSWKPLTKEMTEKTEGTKYGMIFHIPQWQVSTQSMFNNAGQHSSNEDAKNLINDVLPIGFQPFMRCHMQHGYGIKMTDEFPLQEDSTFEKLRFRHSEKLSKEIYERMDQGRLIYPHEGLIDLMDIIETIKESSTFTEDAFDYAFDKSTYFTDKTKCKKLLAESIIFEDKKIIIGNSHPFHLSRQRRRRLDRMYKDFSIEKEYGIKLTTRPSGELIP